MRPKLLITATLLTLAAFSNHAQAKSLTAGAGKAEIAIPAYLYPVDGFVGEHDALTARVLLIDNGAVRIAIVVVDQTSISDTSISDMKVILRDLAGVLPANAIVCASHTFSAPHILPLEHVAAGEQAKIAALEQAVTAAVQSATIEALATLKVARVGFGSGTTRVGVNRDVETPAGWWLSANDAGYFDPAVAVLRLDGLDGQPLALLTNVAVQSSIMDGSVGETGGKLVTSDLAGAAMRRVEKAYGGSVVSSFLVGAAGDQAPYLQANRHVVDEDGHVSRIDIHDPGFALVELLGERLGNEIVEVAQHVTSFEVSVLEVERITVDVVSQAPSPGPGPAGPVKAFDYETGDRVGVPVVIMRIGDVVLVGLQAELSASVGKWIKDHSPVTNIMVMTMVDGAAKYMPDALSYDRFTYEARSARYARGAAEMTATRIVEALKRIQESEVKHD